jgi:hypothetical protein
VRASCKAIERAVILADGDRLLPRHLPVPPDPAPHGSVGMLDCPVRSDVAARFASEAERKVRSGAQAARREAAPPMLRINFDLTAKLRQRAGLGSQPDFFSRLHFFS